MSHVKDLGMTNKTYKTWKSMLGPLVITAVSVINFSACSGHDEEEQVAPNSASKDDANESDAAGEATADAPNEAAAPDSDGEAKEVAASTETAAAADGEVGEAAAEAPAAEATAEAPAAEAAPANDTVAASEPAAPAAAPAAAAPPAPAAAAQPVAASGGAGPGRVVRYIQADQTVLHAAASDAAPVALQLTQGDILMVVEENGWGRVTDQLFVKLDAVSARAVPRTFAKPEWLPPAH